MRGEGSEGKGARGGGCNHGVKKLFDDLFQLSHSQHK